MFKILLAAAAACLLPLAALAHDGLLLRDPFARVTPQAGAVYLMIANHGDADDRLLAVRSDAAMKMMPMTMKADADGTMKMVDLMDGLAIPAWSTQVLAPGQDHLMLMGLTRKLKDGDRIELVLTFERAGEVHLTVPVQSSRKTPPADVETEFDVKVAGAPGAGASTEDAQSDMDMDMDMDEPSN